MAYQVSVFIRSFDYTMLKFVLQFLSNYLIAYL